MNEHPGDIEYLYKYRPIDPEGHTKEIFTHSKLYFNRPLGFNDPFDCRPKFSFVASEDKIKKFLYGWLTRLEPHLVSRQQKRAKLREVMKLKFYKDPDILNSIEKKFVDEDINTLGVCCFSEIPDSILMWSHYSDKHTGICLQFEATSQTTFFCKSQKVTYQKEYPIVNPFIDHPDKQVENALLTKAPHWEYEAEWRIILFENGPGTHTFPPEHLKGVILGANISPENIEYVASWAKERNRPIQIYKANLKKAKYGLDIEPFISID
jgi:hypothetical protein